MSRNSRIGPNLYACNSWLFSHLAVMQAWAKAVRSGKRQ